MAASLLFHQSAPQTESPVSHSTLGQRAAFVVIFQLSDVQHLRRRQTVVLSRTYSAGAAKQRIK